MRGCCAGYLLQGKSDGALGRSRTDNLLIRSQQCDDHCEGLNGSTNIKYDSHMSRFVVDTKRFAIDTLDGETIVMDLVGGRLNLFEEGASTLFEFLTQGAAVAALEQDVEDRYGVAHRQLFADFVRSLVEKEILVNVSEVSSDAFPTPQLVWPEKLGKIIVSEYDDMSSIITMDPIHDVDPAKGWPFQEDI